MTLRVERLSKATHYETIQIGHDAAHRIETQLLAVLKASSARARVVVRQYGTGKGCEVWDVLT
jgi:hypothetical protein